VKYAAVIALLLALVAAPDVVMAHPHILIAQHVRVIAKDGKFTHFEIEWRFDPGSSETEILSIDEDGDGRISAAEVKALAVDMLPELQKAGFMTWLNTGGRDFRPPQPPTLAVRIDDPASFSPPDWNHDEGDKNGGMPMPKNKQVERPPPRSPRNLIYMMRFALPQPVKAFSLTTYDPDDFIRIEVDRASLPKECRLDKHPTYKSEFVPGKPVFAGIVSCKLP
jgi:ABC-type uncharacterized transport system substrate-binding protein